MPKNYKALSERAKLRSNPDNFILEKSFSDELSTLAYSDVLTYIRIAMNGVGNEYTKRSKEAGDRVKNHLDDVLTNVSYKYQGSVMTDTHIKGNSDIDLLVITNNFHYWDACSVKNVIANESYRFNSQQLQKLKNEIVLKIYTGNAIDDLKQNRLCSEKKMAETYDKCDVSHSKAIKITNLNLKRDVDIVIACWYDDINSILNDKGNYRGIQVYNKIQHEIGKVDFPFLSIDRINEKSSHTNGRLKKMIRFLKTIKADSDYDIQLSSFDINAICYDIDIRKYINLSFYELVLVLYCQVQSIYNNKYHSDNLKSVDGREFIFRENEDKLLSLKKVLSELETLVFDLKKSLLIKYVY